MEEDFVAAGVPAYVSGRLRPADTEAGCYAARSHDFYLAANRKVGRKERFVIDLDENGVIARLRKRKVADLVDEIDAMQRTLRGERALDQRLHSSGIETE